MIGRGEFLQLPLHHLYVYSKSGTCFHHVISFRYSPFGVSSLFRHMQRTPCPNPRICLFHLEQSIYWCIQSKGLQSWYADLKDSSIRDAAHLLVALAFLLLEDSQVFILWQALRQMIFLIFTSTLEKHTFQDPRLKEGIVPINLDTVHCYGANTTLISIFRKGGMHNWLQVVIGKHHPGFVHFW